MGGQACAEALWWERVGQGYSRERQGDPEERWVRRANGAGGRDLRTL